MSNVIYPKNMLEPFSLSANIEISWTDSGDSHISAIPLNPSNQFIVVDTAQTRSNKPLITYTRKVYNCRYFDKLSFCFIYIYIFLLNFAIK